ncbi:LuxR C-terminal-related transcriptional regulator [Nocardia sp. NPDC046763]|uniref:LuxR C-terminal-related transcriptional regulator n=1 Tax=Nocardia sp. NPDC046763 TaxID=3155256 RepID=UPI0033D2A669
MQGLADYLDVVRKLDRAAALRRCAELIGSLPYFSIAWTAEPSSPGLLVVRQASGVRTDLMRELPVPTGRGLTGKVYGCARADWVDDYFNSASITHDFDEQMAGEGVRRLLAVPIVLSGKTFGVLAAGSRSEGTFGDTAVAEVTAAAQAAAVAIEVSVRTEQRIMNLHDTIGANLASIGSSARRLSVDPATDSVLRGRLGRIAEQAAEPTAALRALHDAVPPVLTRRELEVLRRAAAGETNPEIARALGLSRHTVKDYLRQALQKLGARNRVQAAMKASGLGLL